jgi:hypothetical protein
MLCAEPVARPCRARPADTAASRAMAATPTTSNGCNTHKLTGDPQTCGNNQRSSSSKSRTDQLRL